jgi:tRNA threonylcarbamoyladenosine biosynthesis protein TsaB
MLLAIDCASTLCAACVLDTATGVERGRHVLDIGKGHAEELMGVIDAALASADADLAAVTRIAVGIGPGSFTGIRVAVSAARGLALALRVPAIGVSTLEALAAEARHGRSVKVMAAFASGPETIQTAVYDEFGTECYAPAVMPLREGAAMAKDLGAVLAGSGADAIADLAGLPGERVASRATTADIGVYARLAATRDPAEFPAVPLYLRAPDAKPQAGFVLPRRGVA